MITQCFTNGTVKLQNDATQIKYNIRHIIPYILDTKVEDYNSIKCLMTSSYKEPLVYFCNILNI